MGHTLTLKHFFIPLAGCLAAALLLNNATECLPVSVFYFFEKRDPELILWLKGYGRLIFSSLATLFLIVLSMRVEVHKVIRWSFIGATALIYLYFFYLIPDFLLKVQDKPFSHETGISFLLNTWVPISFFLVSSYWPSTVILFIYSFANRYLNLTQTYITYPVFAIFGIIIPILFNPSRCPSIAPFLTLEAFQQKGLLAIFLTLLCFLLFEWISLKNKLPEEDLKKSPKFPDVRTLFTQGFLVLATSFLYQLNKSVWFSKGGAVEYPAPQEYTHFLTSFDGLRSLGMLLDVVFLLFILMALEKRAGRAWKNIFMGGVIISLSLGLSLIAYNIFGNDLFSQTLQEHSSLQSFFEASAVGSGYQIFYTAVSYPILLCLKEMTFQIHEPSSRFTAKLFVDLVFAKLGLLLATFASFIGSTLPLSTRLYLFALVLVVVGTAWFCLAYKIGNRVEELSPEPVI